jgi:MerR family copper efflux transcriptional regulator
MVGMRITEAAERLSTTPRMLRYREALGLLAARGRAGRHRRYDERDLRAATLARAIEQRYGAAPAEVAFALRAVSEPDLAARLRVLAELTGRFSPPTRALDFEQEKAQRLLRRP